MLRCAALLVLILSVFVSSGFAGKALVRVYFEDAEHIRTVISTFEDVAGWGGKRYADIVVPRERLDELNLIAPNNEVLIPDVDKHMRQMGILGVGGAYHTQEEAYAEMDSVADANPSICLVQSVGTSIQGRDIWAMKISDNVTVTENEPRVLYLGCHHAREIITVEIPLYMMYYFVDNYGTDSLATYYVDNREIWILPLMNPDGREYVQHTGDWRKNRRNNGDGTYGVDLNRNWGYMWGYDDVGSSPNTGSETYRGTGPFSEPETQAVRDLMLSYQFSTCISYHSHGELILYPWGYISTPCPDVDILSALADSMAAFNDYAPGPGYSLYPVNGDSDDWMYGEQTIKDKVFSYTYEVGTQFYPPESQIIPLCEENFQPSLMVTEYADNVIRILPPRTPVISAMGDDDDGVYTVSWTIDASDTSNPPVQYTLMERSGPSRGIDDVESGALHYRRRGFAIRTNRYHSASSSFYGGYYSSMDSKLISKIALDVETGDTLDFWTWYEIEEDWDYAYVEVSTDGGWHFRSIPGNITTTSNPNGNNLGHGITGFSSGWVHAYFPMDDLADSTVVLRFRYKTDSYVLEEGIYVDDINPVQMFDSTTILSDAITDTSYNVTNPVGTYYYEVRGADGDGQLGYWSQREPITVTGAGIDEIAQAASQAGFANPVRFGAEVRFSDAVIGERIAIYDVQGKLVRAFTVSSSEAQWNLTDQAGNPVSPGIYFIRAGRTPTTGAKKLVVIQ